LDGTHTKKNVHVILRTINYEKLMRIVLNDACNITV